MKIVLVNPRSRGPGNAGVVRAGRAVFPPSEISPHLGLGYLAAALAYAGEEASIVDADVRGLGVDQVVSECQSHAPDIVGVCLLHDTLPDAAELARRLKRDLNVPLVGGGHLPTLSGTWLLNHLPELDFALSGEAEDALVLLIRHLGRGARWQERVPGLVFRDADGPPRMTGPAPPPALAALSGPVRDSSDFVLRAQAHYGLPRAMRVLASRGCAHRCAFCSVAAFCDATSACGADRRRTRPVESVRDEVMALVDQYDLETIYFSDDDFIGPLPQNRERVLALAQALEMMQRRPQFTITCRVDNAVPELLEALKRAGMVHVGVGVESVSTASMRLFRKSTTTDDILAFLEGALALDTSVSLFMIIFHPTATLEQISANYRFLDSLGYFHGAIGHRNAYGCLVASRLIVRRFTPIDGIVAHLGLHRGYMASNPAIAAYDFADPRVGTLWSIVARETEGCEQDAAAVFSDALHRVMRRCGSA